MNKKKWCFTTKQYFLSCNLKTTNAFPKVFFYPNEASLMLIKETKKETRKAKEVGGGGGGG